MNTTAAESSSTVVLATVLAQANIVLRAYEDELASGKSDPAVVASLKTTIEPLKLAISALARAIAGSVGYVGPMTMPPAKELK
jgi:hypothetical protein